jgi:hypothetical protein
VLIAGTGPVADRLRVREIDDDEGQWLLRIVGRETGSVVTWWRPQMVLLSAQGAAWSLPVGGVNGPSAAGAGHGGTGRPGTGAAASTRTGAGACEPRAGCQPSAADRKNRTL